MLVVVMLCTGLLAPGLHEIGHGEEVWSQARQNQADCERHHDGVHVETGYSHLHHAPCVLCSRTAVAGISSVSPGSTRVEWARLFDIPRAVSDDRFDPSRADRGPPSLV